MREGASDHAARDVAIQELVKGDKKGDCVAAALRAAARAEEGRRRGRGDRAGARQAGARGGGAHGAQLLDDTNDAVRGNAAVTLEYIGSAAAVEPLTKRLAKEKDEWARNDCCRALGRCGAKQEAVRKTLLRELATAKTNRLSVGPAIGLSYFDGATRTPRAGSRRSSPAGVDWQKRAFGLYALTEIRDPKSAEFVREKVVKAEKNQAALAFLNAVVAVLAGTDPAGRRSAP